MKKVEDREAETKQAAFFLLFFFFLSGPSPDPFGSCLLSSSAATRMTYIRASGELQYFLIHGRMEHAMLGYPGSPFPDKPSDP